MAVTGAALSHNGVIIAVLFHDMGTFGAALARAFPCGLRRTRHCQSVRRQGNRLCCLGNDHISAAVIIHEQGRINIVHFQTYRLAVRAFRLIGYHHQLSSHHIIVTLAIRIQTQSYINIVFSVHTFDIRCPNAVGIPDVTNVQPLRIRDGMADDMPVNHIPGMGNGDCRKILEARIHHVVIVANTDHRRIRKKASLYRIVISSGFVHRNLLLHIITVLCSCSQCILYGLFCRASSVFNL